MFYTKREVEENRKMHPITYNLFPLSSQNLQQTEDPKHHGEIIKFEMYSPSTLRENWELCMNRITHYQKLQYIQEKDTESWKEEDTDTKTWTLKLKKITEILKLLDNTSIIEPEDVQMVDQIHRILHPNK